ncbi:hypothetical protein XENORESO_021868 [Xenotaenia resolanae]|uniref:Uncharacterized protein n=1 Tax=Xenotaenia resolanae TaxID=208358 RepID=A0ABV0WAW4_9TELE
MSDPWLKADINHFYEHETQLKLQTVASEREENSQNALTRKSWSQLPSQQFVHTQSISAERIELTDSENIGFVTIYPGFSKPAAKDQNYHSQIKKHNLKPFLPSSFSSPNPKSI